jgi:hypothetical protein
MHLSRGTSRNWSGLTFRYRSIVKPSYSGNITNPNVMHNAAGQDSVLRTLALLLAAHSRATPKQAKEPRDSKNFISFVYN